MYLRILKKDLQRKKTMNVIMLIFIILASMFISSSANNMITISTALDDYFEMADVPDYWYCATDEAEGRRFANFAEDNGYRLKTAEFTQIDPKNITISGDTFEYSNTVVLSTVKGSKVFDKNENVITRVNDGEIYVSNEIFRSEKNDFYEGCKIAIGEGKNQREFTLKGYMMDALLGTSMTGMTRFLVSENDYQFFDVPDKTMFVSLLLYTDDENYMDKFNDFDLKSVMNVDRSAIKKMYLMDILIAAVILVVSFCLILISMVILRFTIQFTMSEEFREIGVMKAIGIASGKIRGLYIVKYFAISTVGALIGLGLSIPFGNLLLESVSTNIILSGKNYFILNVIFAMVTAAVVVLFCYFCTRKINKFSPIDAIRNGETGERFSKKGVIHLNKSHLSPALFMALNDILSGIKRYLSMILIFTLGLLLVIIPINTINTLRSDSLISFFSMADCDLVIAQELLFSKDGHNQEKITEKNENLRKTLRDNQIEADVFQEIAFRFTVSKGEKKTSSLAFQGVGDVTTDRYSYIRGTPPQNKNEIALSYITADEIGAKIGDEVSISMGEETRKYTVTAINQSMNNLGESIRFYHGDNLDYNLAQGSCGLQILYRDSPDKRTREERRELVEKTYRDDDVYTAGEYISYMIGDVAGQLESVKHLILGIIICINILVAVLMVKSFITKERGEIAMLKAIGFNNRVLVAWQTVRIGIVMVIAIVIGTVVSTPLTKLTIDPVFRMMGAYSIKFEILPLEVYVIYPLVVLFATMLAAAAGALRLRKICASETSNME